MLSARFSSCEFPFQLSCFKLAVVYILMSSVTSTSDQTYRNGNANVVTDASDDVTQRTQLIAASCLREPTEGGTKTSGDNGFRIKILGQHAPALYIPGQVYTISLHGTYPNQKLIGFMLVAVPQYAQDESTSIGFFQHIDTIKTRFMEKCPHIVTNVYRHQMADVDVLWTAPPAGTGCIEFRATVIEYRDVWYKDDGALTLLFCEDTGNLDHSLIHGVIPECGACGVAKYQMTFQGLWSKETHPKDFPSYQRLLHWSATVGASHNHQYAVWRYGDFASEAVRDLCEFGYTYSLEREMKKNSRSIRTVVKMPGVWWSERQTLASSRWARFSVDKNYHLLSTVTMFGPSPDWCVGVSALNLCLPNNTWVNELTVPLYPWDAGTDDGETYLATNVKSEPQQRIHRLTNLYPGKQSSPFYGRELVRPMATLTLQRIQSKTESLSTCNSNGESEEEKDPMLSDNDYNNNITDYGNSFDNENGNKVPDETPVTSVKDKQKEDLCAVSHWANWTQCSVTCGGGGWHLRKRVFVNPLADKIKCRRVSLTEIEKCQGIQAECINADCEVSAWSLWSECSQTCHDSYDDGERIRIRHYLKPKEVHKHCTVPLKEVQSCYGIELPECYSTTTKLHVPTTRSSTVSTSSSTHHPTPSTALAIRSTNANKIPSVPTPVDCQFSEWTKWSACSASCGDAERVRHRSIIRKAAHGGKECVGRLEAHRVCKQRPCVRAINTTSPTKCKLSAWSSWSSCSSSCGEEVFRYRKRSAVVPQASSSSSSSVNKMCPKDETQRKRCHVPLCNYASVCEMGPWSEWTRCTGSCGSNHVQERSRVVHREAKQIDVACDPRLERRYCILPPCPDSRPRLVPKYLASKKQ